MPDDELMGLAEANKLSDPAMLREQVNRMLDDPKSLAFIRRFPERWLRLYKLGTMPPPGGFYHHRNMETQMRLQIDAFFSDLVKSNGPVRNIIDSDYTFLNERMAQWIYDRDDVWGDGYRKIDPMGFAMENFDPVGKWRTVYEDSKQKIDPSSTLIGDRKLDDIVALKKWLLERESLIAHNLTEKLLTYATGRLMENSDLGEVDRIARQLRDQSGGVRDLIHLVVQSPLFLTK